jgi:hypothetical protein
LAKVTGADKGGDDQRKQGMTKKWQDGREENRLRRGPTWRVCAFYSVRVARHRGAMRCSRIGITVELMTALLKDWPNSVKILRYFHRNGGELGQHAEQTPWSDS